MRLPSKIIQKVYLLYFLFVGLFSFGSSLLGDDSIRLAYSQASSSQSAGLADPGYYHSSDTEIMEQNLSDLAIAKSSNMAQSRGRRVLNEGGKSTPLASQQPQVDSQKVGVEPQISSADYEAGRGVSEDGAWGKSAGELAGGNGVTKQPKTDVTNEQVSAGYSNLNEKIAGLSAQSSTEAQGGDTLEYWSRFENMSHDNRKCVITPEIWDILPQPPIYRTNNLIRKVGSSELAEGKFVYIEGRVLDNECNPVADALVQIWQADARGQYYYKVDEASYFGDKLLYNKVGIEVEASSMAALGGQDAASSSVAGAKSKFNKNAAYDPNFTGSGAATTNNKGYFAFITLMPGKSEQASAPKIHFAIQHRNFYPMQTQMFFPEFDNKRELGLVTGYLSALDQQALIAENLGSETNVNGATAIGQDPSGIKIPKYAFNLVLKQKKPF